MNPLIDMDYIHSINTGRSSLEKWISVNNPEVYVDVLKHIKFGKTFQEKIYCYCNNISEPVVCKMCGKPVNFWGYSRGYGTYCCIECKKKDKDIIGKSIRDALINKYGDVFWKDYSKKVKATKLKRYGSENYLNIEKRKQTCRERYGADSPLESKKIQEKIKNIFQEKYGADCWLSSQDRVNRREEWVHNYRERFKKTHGVDWPAKSEEIKQRISETVQKKYGVYWACLRQETMLGCNKKSKLNEKFASMLRENNIDFVQEFSLENRSYDFKVNNLLIEINPFPTHNSTWGIFGDPKPISYHREKKDLAKKYGFQCLCVWDWDGWNTIISKIRDKDLINYSIEDEFLKKSDTYLKVNIKLIFESLPIYNIVLERQSRGKYHFWKIKEEESNIPWGDQIFLSMIKYFEDKYDPDILRITQDESKPEFCNYKENGFLINKVINQSKHWYDGNQHLIDDDLTPFKIQKITGIRMSGDVKDQYLIEHDYVEIYDCGKIIYEKRYGQDRI